MFEVGDRVFYGVVGVCEVEDIAAPPIKGIDGKYYYLQPVYDDKGIIYSPVDSKKVSMRTIITKEEAQTFLERARNCKSDELLNQKITPNQYDEMVKSQDTEKLAERSPNRVRTSLPVRVTPPRSTEATPPAEFSTGCENHPEGSPDRSAPGYCASAAVLTSSAVRTT